MPSPYILTIQTQLAPPKNLTGLSKQISSHLSNVSASVGLKLSPQTINQLTSINTKLNVLQKNSKVAANEMEELGTAAAQTFKRFAGFTLVIGSIFSFIGAIRRGVSEIVEFDKELVKIRQVSNESKDSIKSLGDEVFRFSSSLGVSSKELLNASQILVQAGLSIDDTRTAIKALALSDLTPTFESMSQTAEGLVAVFSQFGTPAKEFERVLGAINAVSAKFAVESDDLISAIRRSGGAFQAAGGDLNELLALFTSVRATTRESADAIATGFRTIFARLQRPKTASFLESLGINVTENGQFIGPLKAISELNKQLTQLSSTDVRFAQIVEELGGIRQISRVIPLIQQFPKTVQALFVAQQGAAQLARDAVKAQDSFANSLTRTREEFLKMIAAFAGDDSIRTFAKDSLSATQSLFKLIQSLTQLAPLLGGVGLAAAGTSAVPFFGKFLGNLGFAQGNKIRGQSLIGGNLGTPLAGAGLVGGSLILEQLLNKFGLLNSTTSDTIKRLGEFGAQVAAISTALGFTFSRFNARSERELGVLIPSASNRRQRIEANQATSVLLDKEIVKQNTELTKIQSRRASARIEITKQKLEERSGRLAPSLPGALNALDIAKQNFKQSQELEKSQTKSIRLLDKEFRRVERNIRLGQQLLVEEEKKIESLHRQIQLFDSLNLVVSVASSALLTFGNILEDTGRAQLQLGNRGGIRSFRTGRALQGAGTGAPTGAAIGGTIGFGIGGPPGALIGAGIGAGVGATGGAIVSFINSAEEAKRILETVEFERGVKNITKALEDVSSRRAVAELQAGLVGAETARARLSLRNANIADKEGRLGAIQNLLVPLNTFLINVAQTSRTFSEFSTKVGPDVIEFFAEFSETPISKVREQFEQLIGTSVKLTKVTENLSNLRLREFQRADEVNSFVGAIKDSSDIIKLFNSSLSDSVSFIDQGSKFGRTNILDTGSFIRLIRQTLSPLGGRGAVFGQEAIQAAQVSRVLPSALLTAAAGDPFGLGQGIADRIEESLKGVSPFIQQSVRARVEELLGGAATDQKLVQAIQNNVGEVSRQISSGFLETFLAPLQEINSTLVDFTNDLINISDRRIQVEQEISDIVQQNIDTREKQAEFRADFAGRRLGIGARLGFDRQRLATILGTDAGLAGGGPEAIGSQLANSERRTRELNLRLQSSEISARGSIIVELNNERDRINRLNGALKFLGDATARASALQDELNRKRGERETRRDIFTEFLTSGAEGRSRISRAVAGATSLARGGRISSLPEDVRASTVDLLNKLGESLLGGIRAKDILEAAIAREGGGAFVTPTEEERRLAGGVDEAFEVAKRAQQEALKSALNTSEELLSTIRDNTSEFILKINELISAGERQRTLSEIGRIRASLGATGQQLGAIGQISRLTGINTPQQLETLHNLLPTISEIQLGQQARVNAIPLDRIRQGISQIPFGVGGLGAGRLLSQELSSLGFSKLQPQRTFAGAFRGFTGTFSEAELDNLKTEFTKKIGKDLTQSLFTGFESIERIKPGQVSATGFSEFLQSRLQQLSESQQFDIRNASDQIGRIREVLGPDVDIDVLIRNADNLKKLFDTLPQDIGGVSNQFKNLQQQLLLLQQSLGSAFNTDAINGFGANIASFSTAVANIPTDIAMNASHTVDVRINGAEAFASMQPAIRDLIVATTQNEINKMLKSKFPDVGTI